MNDPAYAIIDRKDRCIKMKSETGEMGIFNTQWDAERYVRALNRTVPGYAQRVDIVPVDIKKWRPENEQ